MLVALVPVPALSAPELDPQADYPVKKELSGGSQKQSAIPNAQAEMKSELESYDLTTGKSRLIVSNSTEQVFTVKTLPPDPEKPAPKGLEHAIELKFEKLKSVNEVYMGGMAKPFSTRIDLGRVLSSTPLVIRGDGTKGKMVEGLAEAKAKALGQVRDQASRNTVIGLLDESVLLRTSSVTSTGGCLEGFEKRKLSEKWDFSLSEQGAKLDYSCEFLGWAEAKGRKIAVLGIQLRKSRQVRQQPNGVPGIVETTGKGKIYFVPETQESVMRMETELMAEPMEEEIRRLKAAGKQVPRNRTLMKQWNRLFSL